jgi:uncharacterized protein
MNDEPFGLAVPFRIEGGLVTARGNAKIRDNLIQIIMTAQGERVMRRDYGSGLRELAHDPNSDALRAVLQHQLLKAITQWEPRIVLRGVRVDQKDETASVTIDYVVQSTREIERITVPLGIDRLQA